MEGCLGRRFWLFRPDYIVRVRIYQRCFKMNKVYVGNLPFNTKEEHLRDLFQDFGDIVEISMILDRYSGNFKGFCFITFRDENSAQQSLALNGRDFLGRNMRVSLARENERSSERSSGGGYHRERSGGGSDHFGSRGGDGGEGHYGSGSREGNRGGRRGGHGGGYDKRGRS
jgi:RNA recognition motif-containing protein